MSDEAMDVGREATEIFNEVFAELSSRLVGSLADISEGDRDAVLTAIGKAAWRGILRGIAITTYAVNRQADDEEARDPDADVIRLDPQMRVSPEPDMWAERHGGDV